ncbi:uncharacterized protein CELE_F41E6.1 [Caenorhabditis elegans]|uniref:Uncharacterized protein n=1 Tax=Caenorhabditis elegans TaxID=6239 RepID=D1YSH2_CAEEL|nr:Uncharacterized protein CELE_F41E6.1 [Caenorhabditis elegans]CCD64096.1 Uncharacterized protein CELE_F41E6.1 [Caenorhabditis elegans]|eukprot:NP_505225.2 Uncharacterized protein CELE_F41E6.1 [Caenorhabditis elegans]
MHDAIYLIFIQNFVLGLFITGSMLVQCAGGKKKKGNRRMDDDDADEKITPDSRKPVTLDKKTCNVDDEGYIVNEKDNDSLRTLRYLDHFKPPQT